MCESIIKFKFFFFKYYYLMIPPVWLLIFSILLCKFPLEEYGDKAIVPAIGILLSCIYFIQKQKLDELKLFRELFTEFNARYDRLNDALAKILENTTIDKGTKEYLIIIDYFNLCGEEYFYFSKGYIDPAVWKTWKKGMDEYVAMPAINAIWQEEKTKDAYYGLPL